LIGAEGYGEKTAAEGCGHPVVIEFYKGELRLLVWSDINSEDPTHTISLEGAREDAREDCDDGADTLYRKVAPNILGRKRLGEGLPIAGDLLNP